MLTQDKVIESVQKMAKEFSIDDLVERLIFIEKVENGLQQSANGQIISTTEAKNTLKTWK